MSEAKHTSGPWRAAEGFPSVEADGAPHLALCNDPSIPMAQRRANARLIAAAPELLEALQRARSVIEAAGLPVDTSITRAIAKATGG